MFNSNSIYGSKFKRQNKGQSYGEICEILRDGHMGHFKVSLIKNTACIKRRYLVRQCPAAEHGSKARFVTPLESDGIVG